MSTFKEGLTLFERGLFAQALECFSGAIAINDNAALAYSKRGVCRLRLGDSLGATNDFHSALQIDPRCVPPLVNLGNLALEANDLDAAQRYYEQALKLDETYGLAHYNLGVLLRRRGELAASVRELRLAAKYEARPESAKKRLAFWKRR